MVGQFTGILAGTEQKSNKYGAYCIVRILDGRGKIFEAITRDDSVIDEILLQERLSRINFEAEISQLSNYTKIEFLGLI